MTYLWSGMILLGIVYGAAAGNLREVTEAAVSSSREAVTLCITMAGVTAMWTGIMKIAEMTGLVRQLCGRLRPVLHFLFPGLEPDSKACSYISLNFLSNLLGLNWASTSSGLMAMNELSLLEDQRRAGEAPGPARKKGCASNEMCTFLIINVSSLQLIPINMIAYRTQYGSADPTAIVGPAIAATAVSTAVAVVFCRCMARRRRA